MLEALPKGSSMAETLRNQGGIFRREGEFWTVGLDKTTVRLKDSKGLAYIAYLLRNPAKEFHVLDLIEGISNHAATADHVADRLGRSGEDFEKSGMHVDSLGDAGEQLDEQAKRAYRNRLSELRQELEEAQAEGREDRAEEIEGELEALTSELSRAVGLGGRNRRAASASERARQSITKTIKAVAARIAETDSSLAEFFSRRIRTGTFCSYQPDRELHVSWEFGFGDQDRGHQTVSNIEQQPHDIGRITPSAVGGFAPLTTSNRTPFVGRETESAFLRAALEAKLNGRGSVVALAGGAGVGKTRLATEVAEHAKRAGFRHFVGRCYERSATVPYLAFVEIIESYLAQAPSLDNFRDQMGDHLAEVAQIVPSLRRVFPDISKSIELAPEQQQRYLFQSISEILTSIARQQPCLLVIEDLHWADDSTFALVSHLTDIIRTLPILVIVTYRDDFTDDKPALVLLLEELIRSGIQPLKLRGLPRGSVAEMLRGLTGATVPENLVEAVFAESDGNPFFVEEVYRHFLEEGKIFDGAGKFRDKIEINELDVPDNVRLVLGRRLSRLSDNARQVLSVAAIFGRSFSFMLLDAVVGQTAPDALFEGLEEAQRTGFIGSGFEGPEAPFIFTHELVRQTLLAGISLPRQQRLHAKIAEALDKLHGARIEEHAAEVADHLLKAGSFADPEKASYYLSLAGQALLKGGALEEARQTLGAALRYQQRDVAMRAQTLAALASAERGSGDWNAAIQHLQEAMGSFASIGALRGVGRVVFDILEGFIWTGHFDEAARIAESGLNYLGSDETTYRTRMFAAAGLIDGVRGDYSTALEKFDQALVSASVAPFESRVLAFRAFSHLLFLQPLDALEDARKSAGSTNSQDSAWTHSVALSLAARALYHLGKVEEALRLCAEAEPIAKRVAQLAALSNCHSVQAWIEFGRKPNLAALEQRIRDNLDFDRTRQLALLLPESLMAVSQVKFLTGDWDSAWQAAVEVPPDIPSPFRRLPSAMLIRLAAYSGDRERVLKLVDETERKLPTIGRAEMIGAWSLLSATIEGLAMIGERGRAAQLYPHVRELLRLKIVCLEFTSRFPETIAAIAAGAANDWDSAERHFRSALAQAKELPNRFEEAEIDRFHAMTLLGRAAQRDHQDARTLLNRALERYGEIGTSRHVELTQRLLATTNR